MKIAPLLLSILACFTMAVAEEAPTRVIGVCERVVDGLEDPVAIISLPAEPLRLYIAERRGRVRVVDKRKLAKKPLLNITEVLSPNENPALSSIAFPPNYATSKELYLSYTDKQGDAIIGRFPIKESRTADDESLTVALKVVQPYSHSHRIYIAFGGDGHLYLSLGDAPLQKGAVSLAQDLHSLFGKVLRINLADPTRYTIPPENPFIKRSDAAPEIWASGLQNPVHISFDQISHKLFLLDSGQETHEVNIIEGGKNYGWNLIEGVRCLADKCDKKALTPPIFDYQATPKARAVGGLVYHGSLFPTLRGAYIFSNTSSTTLFQLVQEQGAWQKHPLATTRTPIQAIGQGGDGEIYVATKDGALSKVVPR